MTQARLWHMDMHVHTRCSPDSLNDPVELVARARQLGLSKIAITEHNRIDGALIAQQLAPDLVIVGEEIMTSTGGELIAYYVAELIPSGLSPAETIDRLKAQNAVISVSHPLDRLRGSAMGMAHTLEIMGDIDALEVFNSRCLFGEDNRKAAELARAHGLGCTAGSDAHTISELGAGFVTLPEFWDAETLRASLRQARPNGRLTGIWPHVMSTRAKWEKKRSA
jgi:predicted metal-dependent phosphoesterase TrpH